MIEHNGKKYQKLGLHIHTTRSDGAKSPTEVLRLFKDAGYDGVALTDHRVYGESFVRVEITDSRGRMAWSNPIKL